MPRSGLDPMIDQDKLEDLSRLYRLFRMVDKGLTTLKRALRDSVARRGREVNDLAGADVEDPGGQGDEVEADVKGKGKAKAKGPGPGGGPVAMALKWVEDVLALKDKFDRVLKHALSGDTGVQTTLNEARLPVVGRYLSFLTHIFFQAFESFINMNPKAPEFISIFIDDHLKKGFKGVSAICYLVHVLPSRSHLILENGL